MQIRKIYYSSHFARAFKKLPLEIKKRAIAREKIFRSNCFDARLKTHKLKGTLQEYWSFPIDRSVRILFEFSEENSVGFIDVGDHDIYA